MARFNASSFRSKMSRLQSDLRSANNRLQSQLRQAQSQLRRAESEYRRSLEELRRAVRNASGSYVVATHVEWQMLSSEERSVVRYEAERCGVELATEDGEQAE